MSPTLCQCRPELFAVQSRRIVFNLKPAGWLGWVLLGLLAVPLVLLSFFFVAAAFALAAIVFLLALIRIVWMQSRGTRARRGPPARRDVIDVDAVEIIDPQPRVIESPEPKPQQNNPT